ncbi:hypothetical protein [Saccharicrinis aurantiacus]|uniref:hypothetical protein n=1 Tax=Saccharicrinis aurantiacus TaxID=1849719 RepID=UPI0024904EE7|nr:hypothetical protein [Saccharicrinis aurantiacus]
MLKQNKIQNKLMVLVERKFNHGKRKLWKNKDFESLSFEIHRDTKILISVATLKRFFGKVKTADDYKPQQTTLDALSLYVGYMPTDDTPFTQRNRWIGAAAVVVIIMVAVFVISNLTKKSTTLAPSGTISLLKTEGKCPTTAYFSYTVPETKEPLFIDFGDKSRKYNITVDGKCSHFYAYPGYFNVTLKGDKRSSSGTLKVLAGTEEWNALAYYFKLENRERYYTIPMENCIKDGIFYASKTDLQTIGVNTNEVVVVKLDNYKKTGKSGDQFICTSTFKNVSDWAAVQCYATVISIVGENGKIELKFVGEGCSRFCEMTLGEQSYDNINNDLNGFVVNPDNWIDMMLVNKEKVIDVFVNKELVFTGSYTESIGNIMGASISFNGSGSVNNFMLKTLDNKSIITTDF